MLHKLLYDDPHVIHRSAAVSINRYDHDLYCRSGHVVRNGLSERRLHMIKIWTPSLLCRAALLCRGGAALLWWLLF
jgi:hypothetical protein